MSLHVLKTFVITYGTVFSGTDIAAEAILALASTWKLCYKVEVQFRQERSHHLCPESPAKLPHVHLYNLKLRHNLTQGRNNIKELAKHMGSVCIACLYVVGHTLTPSFFFATPRSLIKGPRHRRPHRSPGWGGGMREWWEAGGWV
jgi:hypothetical protein